MVEEPILYGKNGLCQGLIPDYTLIYKEKVLLAMILVHNHPSGDPTPSQSDISMTIQVQDAGQVLGVTLHDHLIIGKETELSFRASGYL